MFYGVLPVVTHPCEVMAPLKAPSCENAVCIAQKMAPSRGFPCLLISTAVVAAAQQSESSALNTRCDQVGGCIPLTAQ